MDQLVQSIKERGIITPVTLRPKEDGRYEIVSGHRRKKACELAGLDTVKAEVREMTCDEAIILMVESNLQRSTILPSEKAFSYKMRLEAMKRQGKRSDLTCGPVGHKLEGMKSRDIIAKSDLPFGNYYLKEISTDQHYILTDEKFSVSFEYAGQTVDIVDIKANDGKSISNELIYGEVHGMKKDENGKALGGATIGLFYTDGKEPVLTTVSAEDGSFFFKDIPFGEYIVREIKAPEGLVMDETPYAVNIDKDGAVVEIEITNKLIRGNVQLTKVDANYPDHHLSGAEFEVYQNGELVGKMEELADGVYEMDNL